MAFSSNALALEPNGAVGTPWLDRPEKRNALAPEFGEGLPDALEALASDAAVRGILVAGRGKSFCVGPDLAAGAEQPERPRPVARHDRRHTAGRLRRRTMQPVEERPRRPTHAARERAMKAAVFHGARDIRFEHVERPKLEEGEVLLRVRACGICGSDLHTYRHGLFQEVLGVPAGTGRILGHEFSGEVAEVRGAPVGVEVGDRVIGAAVGANAEFVRIRGPATGLLVPFDESIGFVEAATTEPLATSLHAVNLAAPRDHEIHVVMGAGIIGLGVLQCLKSRSSARTVVVDLSEKRLAMASALGADITINAAKRDAVLEMMGSGRLGREGPLAGNVDTVFDCAGLTKSFEGTSVLEQALSVVRQDGQVILVAVFEKPLEIEWNLVVRKGIRLFGSWAWTPEEFVEAARLIRSGEIDRKPLVSHTFPLEEASRAYEVQLQAEEAVKVVLTP